MRFLRQHLMPHPRAKDNRRHPRARNHKQHLRARSSRQMYRVLVIDDDPSGTQLLITLLGLEGHQGYGVENWRDPLHDVEALRPDLVIMDVRLRVTDGLE